MREPFEAYVREHYTGTPVVIACGLPASNKTETMEVVARVKGYRILRTDLIRKEVLKNEDIFDEKVASNMDKRTLVYDEMFRQAGETREGVRAVNSCRRGGLCLAPTSIFPILLQSSCGWSCPGPSSPAHRLGRGIRAGSQVSK